MQTSVLRFPKADRYLRIHESLLAACERNVCAAALVTFFEEGHSYKLAQRVHTVLYNDMAEAAGVPQVLDTSGWQCYTSEQLERGVFIYTLDHIDKALEFLEGKEFISTDVPDHLTLLSDTGRARWFLLRADKINEWFDLYQEKIRPRRPAPARIAPARDKKTEAPKASDAAMHVFDYWRLRLKHVNSVPDAKRLSLIADRIREGRTVPELCLAIEGCAASDYHMGNHPENKTSTVYDRVELIFRNATYVEQFMRRAEGQVTMDIVEERIANKQLIQQLVPAPKVPTFTEERLTNILNIMYDTALAPEIDPQQIRVLYTLMQRRVDEAYSLIHARLYDRIEGSEGMFAARHADRIKEILAALSGAADKTL